MSDEPQRSLAGYKSQVHDQINYENPNEGKPPLNDTDEYILKLLAFPRVITTTQDKELKDHSHKTIKVDKAVCEFEEQQTKNIVTAFFRVDSLNFSEDEAFESAIVRFFKKIKHPLTEGVSPEWGHYFVVGMRFRARVAIGKGVDKLPNGKYFLDIPTCRPLLPSDKDDGTVPTLADALRIAKGAASSGDAFALLVGKVPNEIIQQFVSEDKAGKIKYPIQ
jgi:hypothetical protein